MKRLYSDIFIIGGGAAGLAAAYGAASAGAEVLLCEQKPRLGGVLPQCIHQGFGLGYFGRDLTGPEYCAAYLEKLQRCSLRLLTGATVLKLTSDRTALVSGREGLFEVEFRHCILATGCREQPLGTLAVSGPRPAGIYTAGEAQELVNLGHYDIGERILILGSGDIGQIMARRFSLLGKKIAAMVELRDRLGGMERNRRECIEAFAVPVLLNSTVTAVSGYPRLTGVTVHCFADDSDRFIPCDTLITALGLIPDRTISEALEKEKRPPFWLHFCGNADCVHEIADSVTRQGETLGRKIAETLSCGG